MTIAADMLARIVDAPEDDEARRVYADWLLERGDPRGELINVQLQLSDDPPDCSALEALERALLDEHAEAWLAEIGLEPVHLELGTRFERGFVDEVVFAYGNVPDLGLLARSPVRRLHFYQAHAEPLDRLLAERALVERLSHLAVTGDDRSDLFDLVSRVATLGELPGLRSLDLEGSTPDAAPALAASGVLAHLDHFGYRGISVHEEDHLIPLFATMSPALTSLDLSDSIGVGPLLSVLEPWVPRLSKLWLSRVMVNSDNLVALLERAESLRELAYYAWLHDAETVVAFDALARSPCASTLQTFDVGDSSGLYTGESLDSDVATSLARLMPRLSAIETLRFGSTCLGDRGVATLGAVNTEPLEIDVSFCSITADGLAALLASPRLHAVRRLDLCGNPLGEAGARVLAATPFTRLENIDLRWTDFGVAGAELLATTTHMGTLKSLLISSDVGHTVEYEPLRRRFGDFVE